MRRRGVLAVAVTMLAVVAVPAPAGAWQPGPTRFGVGTRKNVAVKMADGTVLRADVHFPTDPKTGKAAPGPFPVIMVQTPYGKNVVGSASGSEGPREAGTQTGPMPYLIKRGYIDVVADVRGTGDSHGVFGILDPIQGRDGAALVRWAARLPHSNGRVGTYGPSYMGIDQFMTARNLGRGSPLKAMFPVIAANNVYRDLAFSGGMPGAEFDLAFLGLMASLNTGAPAWENPGDPSDLFATEVDHLGSLKSWQLDQAVNILSGGDQSYDQAYWRARTVREMLGKVVRNGIPAFLVGGWFDVFQRGEPLNYSGLQNLYRGRSAAAPMGRRQAASGRYQLLQGPWYHVAAGTGADIYRIELAWFDRWLKNRRTGIDETRRPLHVYALGAGRWIDTTSYPFKEAVPRTYYLASGPSGSGAPSANDGNLSPSRPRGAGGEDPVAYAGASSPCSLQSDQFGAGTAQLVFEAGQLPPNPCADDDRSIQAGPGALTYTTAPMRSDRVVAGPIDATIYASSTRPDVELIATLEDVAPGGKSTPITTGALLGSFRKLNRGLSWRARDGRPLLPYHPYTKASHTPVPTGKVTRFDIEVFPTFAELRKGHRLRFTLTSSDSPHVLPTIPQQADLAGGVYRVQRNAAASSYLEIPMARADAFARCRGRLAQIFHYTSNVERPRVDCR